MQHLRMQNGWPRMLATATIMVLATSQLQAGLVGYWNFDNNVNDAGAYGNNGTIYGTVPYVAGKFGGTNGAVSFNNDVANYVEVLDSASLHAAWPGLVLSFWVNTAVGGNRPLAKFAVDGTGKGIGLADGSLLIGGTGGGWHAVSAGTYSDSTWRNLVLRWDGTNLVSYMNGSQIASSAAADFANSTNTLIFGRDNRSAVSPYNGKMDDVAIFDTALTVGQSKAIYNVGNSTLGYSMADMAKLFALYANAGGTTNTSDGKTWEYAASGLPGAASQVMQYQDKYSIIFSDTGSAGVRTGPTGGWTLQLISYWNFDNNVNDAGTNGNNGTIYGTVPYVAGKFGGTNGAVSFNNDVANYVEVLDSASLHAAWPGLVLSFWVNTAVGGNRPLAKLAVDGTGKGVGLADGNLLIGSTAGGWHFVSAGAYANSTWKNLVLRWDGTNLVSYMNGSQNASSAAAGFINSTNTLVFGRDNRSATAPYTGKMDDVAIFGAALTVGQCKAIYNVGNSTLNYSMDDMLKLFELYANVGGKTTTSDGKIWEYVASGLSGAPGELASEGPYRSVVFSDTGSAGIRIYIPAGTVTMFR